MAQGRGKGLKSHKFGPAIISVPGSACIKVMVEISSQFQGPLNTVVSLQISCHCNCTDVFQHGFCLLATWICHRSNNSAS